MNGVIPTAALLLATLGVGAGAYPVARTAQIPAIPAVIVPSEGISASGNLGSVRLGPPAANRTSARRATRATTAAPRPRRTASPPNARPVGHILMGTASWFCVPGRSACTYGFPASGMYAAAGPALRAALGDWRGRVVRVSTGRASVNVRLIDWCGCPDGRVIDLYASVFGGLGVPLSAGLVDLEVAW